MLSETLEKVRRHWSNEGIKLAPALHEDKLNRRLSLLGINPSPEILKVFSMLTGFANGDMDSECLTFWTVEKIWKENDLDRVKETGYVHFADFLIFSHTYAFKIDATSFASVYCHYDSDYIVKVADSFEEFFEYYLTEPLKLLQN